MRVKWKPGKTTWCTVLVQNAVATWDHYIDTIKASHTAHNQPGESNPSTKLPAVWMTAHNSTAIHCSGSNCGKAPLCTKIWCTSVSLTVAWIFLIPPYKFEKKKGKNNFPNNCFWGECISDVHEVFKYKRGRVKITNSFRAKQAMNILFCQNKHVFFHLFFNTFKWAL